MSQIIVGHFEADGALIYLPIGFIPDHFRLVDFHTNTNIFRYEWWRLMELDMEGGKQEGISYKEAISANLGDAGGITAYDSGAEGPTVVVWSAALGVSIRSASAHGTYIRPTTSSEMDREAIFEVLTNVETGATEPTWPAAIGEQVKDNHGTPVVYERVNVPLKRTGYQGVCLAAALTVDSQECFYTAIQADDSIDHGDVLGWTDGIYGT